MKSTNDCFWNQFFHRVSILISYNRGSNVHGFCTIIYSFVCQFSLHYYWYCYNQKQSSGEVLQKSVLTNGYFYINTLRLFKNDVTHIFRLSIFSAYFEDWEQEWAQYFKPLAWSLFPTQSKIWDGAVFGKIVSSLKTLSISAKKPVWLGSNYASVSSH